MYSSPLQRAENQELRTTAKAPGSRLLASGFRLALAYGLLLAAAIAIAWLSLMPPRTMSVDIGSSADELAYLRGVYNRERVESRTYRWSRGDASITLPAGGSAVHLLRAEFHGPPGLPGGVLPVALVAGGRPARFAVVETERSYALLAPADPDGVVRIRLDSPTITPPGDSRLLAIALDRLSIAPVGPGRISAGLVAAEALLLLGVVAALQAAGTARLALAGALLAAGLLAWLNLEHRLWIAAAAWPLALAALALAALALAGRRWLAPRAQQTGDGRQEDRRRETGDPVSRTPHPAPCITHHASRIRHHASRITYLLWLIFLAGFALRLLGVLAPGFEVHDLDIQTIQFREVASGQMFLDVHSHEWGSSKTFYPPGPYLLLLPLLLAMPGLTPTLHVGAALIDAAAPLLLALLARRLGMQPRAALLAAALLAFLPIQLTALWWGFFTNLAGQCLLILAAWLLLRFAAAPGRDSALLATTGLLLVMLSHVGVLVMAAPTLALAGAWAWLSPRTHPAARRGLLLVCAGAVAFVALVYLAAVVAPMLDQAGRVFVTQDRLSPAKIAVNRERILGYLPLALWRGLLTLPLLAIPAAVALIWRRAPTPLGRGLLVGWTMMPVLFFAIYYIFAVQARYVYFAAPLSCLALGALLAPLTRSRAGRVVAVACVLLISLAGAILWINGAVLGFKPSLVPLTH